VSDTPAIASNCFGTYPVRNEIYLGVRGGAERAEDAFQNEDIGGFGEITLGGEQVSASATRGLYVTVGASVAPDATDAPSSPATSVYAMGGFQLTFS
jgi:hypothetical protein